MIGIVVLWGIMTAMTDCIWEEAIMDTDFAFKLEKVKQFNAIETYIPQLVNTLYIHRYVYENEILVPLRTKEQINKLIDQKRAVIVEAETLKLEDPLLAKIYQQTIYHLETVEEETKQYGKNWGEIVSIAYARAKGIPFIFSDESKLQELLDNEVNSEKEDDLLVIRLRDFILAMKEKGLKRKEAYIIWCAAHQENKGQLEWAKKIFKEELWAIKS